MKKFLSFLVILICLFGSNAELIANGQEESLEIELRWDFSKNLSQNLFVTSNFRSAYNLTGYGIGKIFSSKSFLGRTAEIGLGLPFAISFTILDHEAGHSWVAIKNGSSYAPISWSPIQFWIGSMGYVGEFSRQEEIKIDMAGLVRSNEGALTVIDQNLGKTIRPTSLIWFELNQLNTVRHIIRTSKKTSISWEEDIKSWISYLTDSGNATNSLYEELKIGAAWQSLGAIIPGFAGLRYWLTGKTFKIPKWYLNPQIELTNAGMMYVLTAWYQLDNNIIFRIRPGWGRNRIQGGGLTALEAKVSNIPLHFLGIKGGISAGFSKTLKTSTSFGILMEKILTEKILLGVDMNYYSGYHRNNPYAKGSYTEITTKLMLFF